MEPVEFPESNKVFHKPDNMSEDECGSLHVHQKSGVIVSCWELSPEELKIVNETKKVWLGVLGQGHPPVFLSGTEPYQITKARLDTKPVIERTDQSCPHGYIIGRQLDNHKECLDCEVRNICLHLSFTRL